MEQINNEIQNVTQMTDAELRRALDYTEGDEVIFISERNAGTIGVIESIRPGDRGSCLLYQVRVKTKNGIKFMRTGSYNIRRIKHADE